MLNRFSMDTLDIDLNLVPRCLNLVLNLLLLHRIKFSTHRTWHLPATILVGTGTSRSTKFTRYTAANPGTKFSRLKQPVVCTGTHVYSEYSQYTMVACARKFRSIESSW
jgi:hypothetical protein